MELSRQITPTANIAYAVSYAQVIIEHFSKALEENGCLIQVPAALYVEIDDQYNRLVDYIESAVNSGNTGVADNYATYSYQEGDFRQTEIAQSVREAIRRASNDCFNCNIPKPKFDFSGIFDNLMAEIQSTLEQFGGMFKYNKASVCQYSFFLSYLCIPDLLKLVSLILAAITKLLSGITLPRITIALFINAILSAIIEVLVRNISILARFALTPVLCILDAIDSIISQLPTPENIRAQNEQDLIRLGVNEKFMQGEYDTGLADKSRKIREAYTSRVRKYEQEASMNTQKYVKEIFGPLEETINKSVDSLNNSIAELTGLLNHFSCEPSRSGLTVSQYLSNLSEFMALVNLLRYIIKFKGKKAAFEQLCNAPTDSSNYGNNNYTDIYDTPMSTENIGSIIADVLGSDIDIITDDEGNPIAIGIKNPDSEIDESRNLSFWSCNLRDFAESVIVPNLINDIIQNDIPTLNIDDFNMTPWKVTVIPNSSYTPGFTNTDIIPLVIDEVWNLPDHIRDIISLIDTYNGATNPTKTEVEVTFVADEGINDIIKSVSKVLPNSEDRVTGLNDSTVKIVSDGGNTIKVIDNNGNVITGSNETIINQSANNNLDKMVHSFSQGTQIDELLDCKNELDAILNKLGGKL